MYKGEVTSILEMFVLRIIDFCILAAPAAVVSPEIVFP